MNYTVDIIDTIKDNHTLSLERAQVSSLLLRWNGGQEKDSQNIIGSSFSFTMEVHVSNRKDGTFRHLFTGDETRYKVLIYLTDTPDEIVWSGFLLPDRYAEPYAPGTFYPSFEAVDGLGRLKGKFLDPYFYTKENSVIAIVSACLQKTGLQLPLLFAPAIENVAQKEYDNIYLYGKHLTQENRPLDCYSILFKLLADMVCVVYQSENKWWVEGINRRHLQVVPFKEYTWQGVLVSENKYSKLRKDFNGLDTPQITVVPPYNQIYVAHKRQPQALPDTIAQEQNDNWAIGQGVEGDISPTFWFGRGGYRAEALAPSYKVVLPTSNILELDDFKYVALKDKIYVNQFDKLVFSATFKTPVSAKTDDGITPNGLKLLFLLDGFVIYSVERSFEDDDEIEMDFDLFINSSGLLDLQILQPYFGGNFQDKTYARFLSIEKMELKVTGFNETLSVTDVINEDFTTNKEIDLTFSDDATGFSKAFRLEKLENRGTESNFIPVPILYARTFQGKFYSIVSLFGANLIADNLETVQYQNQDINILNVFYNWRNGEEMVIETESLTATGVFQVQQYRADDVNGDRKEWEIWTDAVYPIESDRYNKSVANVFRRLFINAHERVEYLADGAYKFNDLVAFDYMLPANYFITNLTWNIDRGQSEITMIKCVYQNQIIDVGSVNIPPICNAGEDVILPVGFGIPIFGRDNSYTHTSATAFDPDGFISSWFWEIIEGDTTMGITGYTNQYPTISNFLGNEIVLKLTVTDSDGATASDTVKITRRSNKVFSLVEENYFNTDGKTGGGLAFKKDSILFSPALADNEIITVKGRFYLKHLDPERYDNLTYNAITTFQVVKNGVLIINNILEGKVVERLGDFEFNYVNGDVIEITVQCFTSFVFPSNRDYIDLLAGYEINSLVFQQGSGAVTGYPISQEVKYIGNT